MVRFAPIFSPVASSGLGRIWRAIFLRTPYKALEFISILRRLPAEGQVIVDLGGGVGAQVCILAGRGRRVVSIDSDLSAMRYGATVGNYDEAQAVAADISRLPIRTGAADAVVSFGVLEHVTDATSVAAEALRVLRPGGVLVLTADNMGHAPPEFPIQTFISEYGVVNFYDRRTIAALFGSAGFEIRETTYLAASRNALRRLEGHLAGESEPARALKLMRFLSLLVAECRANRTGGGQFVLITARKSDE